MYRNDESKILIVDSLMLKFTPVEYRLLLALLSGQAVADAHLAREAFSCELDRSVQKNLDKHIDKIRAKLQLAGLAVHRVSKYGYVLLAVPVWSSFLSLSPICSVAFPKTPSFWGEKDPQKEGLFSSSFLSPMVLPLSSSRKGKRGQLSACLRLISHRVKEIVALARWAKLL
jgi:hypothetical protein